MTTKRQDLLEALTQIQNHRDNHNRDILTITGFMTDAEVAQHIEAELLKLQPRAA